MKRYTLPLILASTLLVQSVSAQSSTPVIGYYKVDVPAGSSIWTCGFVTKKEFQGAMTSIAVAPQSTIFQSGATFGDFTTLPHYVEILSGPKAGWVLDVVPGGDATHIKVDADLSSLVGTETYCVRKHNSLGGVFANGGGLVAGVDTVALITEAGTAVYQFDGSAWIDGDLNDASNVTIYPGQGFIIGTNAVATVTFGGNEVSYVKTGPTKIPLYPGIPNLVGLVNPLVGTAPADQNLLGSYGFVSSLVAGVDTVDLRLANGLLTSVGVFQSDGATMIDPDLNDASAQPVRNGSGLIVGVNADGTYTAPQLHP
jgi:hypothetical protein